MSAHEVQHLPESRRRAHTKPPTGRPSCDLKEVICNARDGPDEMHRSRRILFSRPSAPDKTGRRHEGGVGLALREKREWCRSYRRGALLRQTALSGSGRARQVYFSRRLWRRSLAPLTLLFPFLWLLLLAAALGFISTYIAHLRKTLAPPATRYLPTRGRWRGRGRKSYLPTYLSSNVFTWP